MKYKILILLIVSLFFMDIQAQKADQNKTEVDVLIDDLFEDENDITADEEALIESVFLEQTELENLVSSLSDFKFLYFSMDYTSDTYFTGRDIGIDQYNLRPQVTYMNAKGFFASVSSIYYDEFDPQWDFISLTTGYGKSIGRKKLLRLTASYSRFIYLNDLDNAFTNSITTGVGIRNKKRSIGTRLSTTFSFGGDTSFQISSNSFLRFKLFKKSNSSLYLRPSVNFQIGDQIVFQESGIIEEQGVEFIDFEEQNVFDLLNIQYSLPLLYTIKNFDFELSYHINTPKSHGFFEYDHTSFFNFSVAYLLEL
ncbi:hypothetical protein ACXGQW_03740 [Wenyingzhuangia sp. IMCC45533]